MDEAAARGVQPTRLIATESEHLLPTHKFDGINLVGLDFWGGIPSSIDQRRHPQDPPGISLFPLVSLGIHRYPPSIRIAAIPIAAVPAAAVPMKAEQVRVVTPLPPPPGYPPGGSLLPAQTQYFDRFVYSGGSTLVDLGGPGKTVRLL